MSTAAPRTTSTDLIGATLLFSLLLHGVLILGITFGYIPSKPSLPTLDVTLVDVANREAPDKADFLAQANNKGGGESDKVARPSQPVSGPMPKPLPGTAQQEQQATVASPQEATPDKLLVTSGKSRFTVSSDEAKTARNPSDLPASDEDRLKQEAAQLAAERRSLQEAYAKRPRKKFISSSTREYAYAAYMRGWVDRIERIGNLNYPDAARRQQLHGDVLLTVTIDRTGKVMGIEVINSSGHELLDKAAQRIVRLSAPFPPLPADGNERVDELHITRTWQFQAGDVLHTR
ncbi:MULTISPECIES: energy transducer TonB [Dyella]|uniref:Energy transducer TonB n=2 Tax=Dyella TaxID=231454 RepID=A0A4V2NM75_9GAMM|nr:MULTISPECIES: energy transducer TonB [Dyella]TBR40191.1 energy transducer TonB [Dyella terrae]TCI12227.1 energy transducer TonB [Dyella soli]